MPRVLIPFCKCEYIVGKKSVSIPEESLKALLSAGTCCPINPGVFFYRVRLLVEKKKEFKINL